MTYLQEVLAQLPDNLVPSYDGMTISDDHYKRLVVAFRETSPESTAETPTTFGGIPVVANPNMPDGFAVVTKAGKPVGIIDFAKGEFFTMRSDAARARL